MSFEYVFYTQILFIILHIKYNMIYIGYVTMKLFVVCHTVPFLETNVSVLEVTKGSVVGGQHFMGVGLGQKL